VAQRSAEERYQVGIEGRRLIVQAAMYRGSGRAP